MNIITVMEMGIDTGVGMSSDMGLDKAMDMGMGMEMDMISPLPRGKDIFQHIDPCVNWNC
jgi:hypothetical protein